MYSADLAQGKGVFVVLIASPQVDGTCSSQDGSIRGGFGKEAHL